MPTTSRLNSLPAYSLGVLISWFRLMDPADGAMACMIKTTVPKKITAMASRVPSNTFHQPPFFFFLPFGP